MAPSPSRFARLWTCLLRAAVVWWLCLVAPACKAPPPRELPHVPQLTQPAVVPSGLGYNIHFTHAQPRELELLASSGATLVRMDLFWSDVEKSPGVYDFNAYDHLVRSLQRHGLNALFILDYGNPLYDQGLAPHTPQARAAFVRFAVAAVQRYRGRGYLWEIWNEPNVQFWLPAASPQAYSLLLKETTVALRRAAPRERLLAPALAGIDLPFLQTCIDTGALSNIDAVTVHPYRQDRPETVVPDYRALRQLLLRSGLSHLPVLSGEWGYSSVWTGMDDRAQADALSRQWLVNLSQSIPVSVWYDWRDDGTNPAEPEHHFGTVDHNTLQPKPAYDAASLLISELRGFTFSKRLSVSDDPGVWVLVFVRPGGGDDSVRFVVWRASGSAASVELPASAGVRYLARTHAGKAQALVASGQNTLSVALSSSPIFLRPLSSCPRWSAAGVWNAGPEEMFLRRGESVVLPGVTGRVESGPGTLAKGGLRCQLVTSDARPQTVVLVHPEVPQFRRHLTLVPVDPVAISLRPTPEGRFRVDVSQPSGPEVRGVLVGEQLRVPFHLHAGASSQSVDLPANSLDPAQGVSVRAFDHRGRLLAEAPQTTFEPVPLERLIGLSAGTEGDPKVGGTAIVKQEPDAVVLEFSKPAPGWRYALLKPSGVAIAGRPDGFGVYVQSDGKASSDGGPATICIRFRDATGQVFQSKGPPLTWTGWRYVVFSMAQPGLHSWGGAKDGVIHYPIEWDTVMLLDPRGDWTGTARVGVRGGMLKKSGRGSLENDMKAP